jgi:hypothetical protein
MCSCGEHHGLSCPQKEASLMTAEAHQRNPIEINKQRMLSAQKPNSRRRFSSWRSSSNPKPWWLDYHCKEYKLGRRKRSNKQNRKTRQEKKLSHLGADDGTEPGSDKPQPKTVRPMYVTPIQKNSDAQVDLPRTMLEQSEKWRNHSGRRMDKL